MFKVGVLGPETLGLCLRTRTRCEYIGRYMIVSGMSFM